MARLFADPLDPSARLCACGHHASPLACDGAAPADGTGALGEAAEQAVYRAVFPNDATRRGLLGRFGAAAVGGALASFFPLDAAREAMAQGGTGFAGVPEKKDLKIGFIPITCATPIIMAHPLGFYQRHGLAVMGWPWKWCGPPAGRSSATAPSPANTMRRICSRRCRSPCRSASASPRDPLGRRCHREYQWPGDHPRQQAQGQAQPARLEGLPLRRTLRLLDANYLLRHYLAEAGIDPDRDVQIRSVPPPEMVANLRADNIDGFLGPAPFNQRAVFDGIGLLHLLTKELWDGHPCCAFAVPRAMSTEAPNTFAALMRSIVEATAYSAKAENRVEVAKAISGQNYLNQPETVVTQVLTGTYADGLGAVKRDPGRIGFDPFPWHSMAIWIMTQMRRWGQVKRDLDYAAVASQVFLALDAGKAMAEQGLPVPASPLRTETIMGRTFDPAAPAAWAERNIRAT